MEIDLKGWSVPTCSQEVPYMTGHKVDDYDWLVIMTCRKDKYIYYTALLNAVECSIKLNGPSQRSSVNYFCIIAKRC